MVIGIKELKNARRKLKITGKTEPTNQDKTTIDLDIETLHLFGPA